MIDEFDADHMLKTAISTAPFHSGRSVDPGLSWPHESRFRADEQWNYGRPGTGDNSAVRQGTRPRILCVLALLCSCALAVPARAQQPLPEDPEDEKQIGLWLDQGISTGLSANKSLEVEFHERFDEGASNLFEYFVQGGVAFRLRPWFTLIPIYRYQRFPGNPTIAYENRLQLNLTLSTSRGPWRRSSARSSRGDFPMIGLLRHAFDFAPASTTPCRFARRGLRCWS